MVKKAELKKIFLANFLVISLIIANVFVNTSAQQTPLITHYQSIFIPYYNENGSLRIAIRMYFREKIPYLLVVDPYNFSTKLVPAVSTHLKKVCHPSYCTEAAINKIKETPYAKALLRYTSSPYRLQNYGVVQADNPVDGVFLTIDMCPSRRPFEKRFFSQLVAQAKQVDKPAPIAIAITGLWIMHHAQEFAWLLQQESSNTLQITWINHSYHHPYYIGIPLRENFLLTPSSNISHEVLDTEKLLIMNGQAPSVFFRFPGLVASKGLILKLRQFGLIPIGSNAWLAKRQKVKLGSIILVHGNGNEPQGIALFTQLQEKNRFHLLPLYQVFKR